METKALKGLQRIPNRIPQLCPADWLLLLARACAAPTAFSQKDKAEYLPSKSQVIFWPVSFVPSLAKQTVY